MMNAILSNLFYLLRWGVWLIRWMLFAAYGAVEFVSKLGSRLIVPVLAAAASYVYRLPLDAAIERYVLHVDWRHMPEPATLYTVAALALVLAICVFVALFSIGGVVLLFALRVAVLVALVLAGAYLWRDSLEAALERNVPQVDWHHMHLQARTSDAMLVLGLVLATCVYVTLSRLLVLLLGAFPPVVRPLRPVRALRVKTRSIRPVVVCHAVPKLPRRRPALGIGHDPA